VDDLPLFDRWDDPELAWPEPVDDPLAAGVFDQFQMIATDCRVALSGEGSDNLMYFEMWPYAKDLARHKEWGRLFTDVPRYLRMRRAPWRGIGRRIKNLFREDPKAATFPAWIAPDFAKRTDVEARWRDRSEFAMTERHPVVPAGHASLALPHWTHMFEQENPGVTRQPVEVRHPFIDLRVVEYLLALPPFPHFLGKRLLREAMSGRLPESIRVQPKAPLEGDPLVEMLKQRGTKWVDHASWNEEVQRYVDTSGIAPLGEERKSGKASMNIRPLCLNLWLQSARRVRYNLNAEVRNG
jgi:asparagine synthase (glutamine-hydrolysing)